MELSKVRGEALAILKEHLAQVEDAIRERGDRSENKTTFLRLRAGNSELGKLVADVETRFGANATYSPFELQVIGADAFYDELKKNLSVSAGSAIDGFPDLATLHELIHLRISERDLKVPEFFHFIFFVSKREDSLRPDANYYTSFLRVDEILTHLMEIHCTMKNVPDASDLELAQAKAGALEEILITAKLVASQTLSGLPKLQAKPNKLRAGRPTLKVNKFYLDADSATEDFARLKSELEQLLGFAESLIPAAEKASKGDQREIESLQAEYFRLAGAWGRDAVGRCK